MEKNIHLKLRSEILEISLNLEQNVNELLLVLLLIQNQKRKAITNKSGNLSFKNKIDLLFDLDVLANDEHQKLLLLMEFRNQFLHNIECSYFEIAVKLLGVDKGKKLLKFDDADKILDKEYRYQNAFRNLNVECLKILIDKLEDRKNQIEDRRKTHVKSLESQIFIIDKYFDVLENIMVICENNYSEIPEVIQLINQLKKSVTDDMELLSKSEEYIQIQNETKELYTPEKIAAFFRR